MRKPSYSLRDPQTLAYAVAFITDDTLLGSILQPYIRDCSLQYAMTALRELVWQRYRYTFAGDFGNRDRQIGTLELEDASSFARAKIQDVLLDIFDKMLATSGTNDNIETAELSQAFIFIIYAMVRLQKDPSLIVSICRMLSHKPLCLNTSSTRFLLPIIRYARAHEHRFSRHRTS